MKPTRWIVFLGLAWLGAAPGAEAGYSAIVAFGDSLTDTGNLSILSGGQFPGPDYYQGRFSNGPVWIETLASRLNLQAPAPSFAGGTNFAVANAETAAGPNGPPSGVPNMDDQINLYRASGLAAGAAQQLFVVWGGANDLLHQTGPDPSRSVTNILNDIRTLAGLGGRDFLVPNLPMLGSIPAVSVNGPGAVAYFNALTSSFNDQLAAGLQQLRSDLGVTIRPLDIDGLFQQLLTSPGTYGLQNIKDPAYNATTRTIQPNPNSYLFWDTVHPTANVHQLIGIAAAGQFATPEPASFVMVGLGLIGTGVVAARRSASRSRRAAA